jgi:UrcA family protein
MISKHVVRMAALAFSVAVLAPSAQAETAWKVGNSYVIRFDHLDLSQPADRQALLVQVERLARRLCLVWDSHNYQKACMRESIDRAFASAPPEARRALDAARLERNRRGAQQSQPQ